MSWWKRLFGAEPYGGESLLPPVASTELATEDHDDELLTEARNFIALTGSKSPAELARSLRISHDRAFALIEAVTAKPLRTPKVPSSANEAREPSIKQPATLEAISAQPMKKREKVKPSDASLPPLTGKITGAQKCEFNIVGESYFQPALRRLRNGRHMATDNDFIADIVGEPSNSHDENACAIYIEGSKVGYLPRAAAKEFVKQMRAINAVGAFRFQAKAKLAGGWGDKPMIGVLLNLPKT